MAIFDETLRNHVTNPTYTKKSKAYRVSVSR